MQDMQYPSNTLITRQVDLPATAGIPSKLRLISGCHVWIGNQRATVQFRNEAQVKR